MKLQPFFKSIFALIILTFSHSQTIAQPCGACDLSCITCNSIDGFSANTRGAPGNTSFGVHCTGFEHQITWLGFYAASTNLTLEICASNCTDGVGIEVLIAESIGCSGATAVSNCYGYLTAITDGNCKSLTSTQPLVIGQYYWLIFDTSFNGTGTCDYVINEVSGMTGLQPPDPSEVLGPSILCVGETGTYFPDDQPPAISFEWELDGVYQGLLNSYDFTEYLVGTYELCITPLNDCNQGPKRCKDINVGQDYFNLHAIETCKDDCVDFEGITFCDAGFHEVLYFSTNGCDSIEAIEIIYLNPDNYVDLGSFQLCEGDSLFAAELSYFDFVNWNIPNEFYYETGNYQLTVSDFSTCKYYYDLEVEVFKRDSVYYFESICQGDSLVFGGDILKSSGVYLETFIDFNSCEGLNILDLKVLDKSSTYLEESICSLGQFTVGDSIIKEAGAYEFIFENSLGCDSIVYLNFYNSDTILVSYDQSICRGDSIIFADTILRSAGVYTSKLKTPLGCDSIETLSLSILENSQVLIQEELCYGESYEIDNSTFDVSGSYEIQLSNYIGCDSTILFDLVINDLILTDLNREICDGDSVLVGTEYFSQEGIFEVLLKSKELGCDSIVRLELKKTNLIEVFLSESICENEIFDFFGEEITTSGTYLHEINDGLGCDSSYTLVLEVLDLSKVFVEEVICSEDSLVVNGEVLFESDVYLFNLLNSNNCDSIVELNLIVLDKIETDINEEICEGEFVEINNVQYQDEGTYPISLKSEMGCDSIIYLNLNVKPNYETQIGKEICQGDSIFFGDVYLFEDGTYLHVFESIFKCDSTVILQLELLSNNTHQLNIEICAGESYEFGTQELVEAGSYELIELNSMGCDSTIELELIVNAIDEVFLENEICNGDSIWFNDQFLFSANEYLIQLVNQNGCDSMVFMDLKVFEGSMTQEIDSSCLDEIIIFEGLEIIESGLYEAVYENQFGCDSILQLEAIFIDCEIMYENSLVHNDCYGNTEGSIELYFDNFIGPLEIELFDGMGSSLANSVIPENTPTIKFDGLAAGKYTLQMVDGFDKIINHDFTILENPLLETSQILSDYNAYQITCNGEEDGSIEILISGGMPPYDLPIWNDGFIGSERISLGAGFYSYEIVDAAGCIFNGEINLNEPAPLELALNIEFELDCDFSSPTLNPEFAGGVGVLTTQIIDPSGELFNQQEYLAGSYTFMVADENNCSISKTFEIPELPIIDLDLGLDIELFSHGDIRVEPNLNFFVERYYWYTDIDSDICSNCDVLELRAEESMMVYLEATSVLGCVIKDSLYITVHPQIQIYIPNVFSPGSVENGYFNIFFDKSLNLRLESCSIYTRWGEQIFQKNDFELNSQEEGWDGSSNGELVEQGVYFYLIKYLDAFGIEQILSGDITVLR